MDDDYIDDDGTIWIWKVLARPSYPAHDPRRLSPEMRDRLVEHRLAQMKREAERNIKALQKWRRAAAQSLRATGLADLPPPSNASDEATD